MANAVSPTTSPAPPFRRYNRSPSPQPTLSKRDKRRAMLSDKLNEMIASFTSNSFDHYYAQLSALQCDINLVMRTDPYSGGPIDDSAEELARLVAAAREEATANRPIAEGAEESFQALCGKFYGKFVEEVNKAMEERDRDLTMAYNQYQSGIDDLRRTHQYRVQLAHEEHRLLSNSIRERLIHSVTAKKARLLRDKEQLDIADSNALLLNPSQFTLGNPTASPGGPQANRKTRNTRGRPGEAEDNTIPVADGPKRKRKAAAFEDDDGTPVPQGRTENGTSTPYIDHRARLIHSQFEAPLYSIDRLFTEKELAMNLSRAHYNTSQHFASLREQGKGGGAAHHESQTGAASALAVLDAGDFDSDAPAGAASPSLANALPVGTYHATRSTQRANPLTDLANAATSMAPFQVSLNATATKSNPAAPLLSGFTELERENDLQLMNRPVGDPSLEMITERSVEKAGPVEGVVAQKEEDSGPSAEAVEENATIENLEEPDATVGAVPMSKQSSTGGHSEAGVAEANEEL